jgi:hypothetical protein
VTELTDEVEEGKEGRDDEVMEGEGGEEDEEEGSVVVVSLIELVIPSSLSVMSSAATSLIISCMMVLLFTPSPSFLSSSFLGRTASAASSPLFSFTFSFSFSFSLSLSWSLLPHHRLMTSPPYWLTMSIRCSVLALLHPFNPFSSS